MVLPTPDDEGRSDIRVQFRWSLQALASDAESQRRMFPDFVCKTDELALDYGQWLEVAVRFLGPEFSGDQLSAIQAIHRRLQAMGLRGPDFTEELWFESSLATRPEWEEVRALARFALSALGWPAGTPPLGRSLYESSDPDVD